MVAFTAIRRKTVRLPPVSRKRQAPLCGLPYRVRTVGNQSLEGIALRILSAGNHCAAMIFNDLTIRNNTLNP
jgi:hypothetical protein